MTENCTEIKEEIENSSLSNWAIDRKSVDKEDFDISNQLILFDVCRLMLAMTTTFSRFNMVQNIFLINGQIAISFVPQFPNICGFAYISLLFISNLILYGQKIYSWDLYHGTIFCVC